MKIGIVGSSKANIQHATTCAMNIMMQYTEDTEFVSGGADGVDKAVEDACFILSRKITIFKPQNNQWEPHGYRERNWKISQYCDEVICIALPSKGDGTYCYHCGSEKHERTGGCYTAVRCKKYRHEVLI